MTTQLQHEKPDFLSRIKGRNKEKFLCAKNGEPGKMLENTEWIAVSDKFYSLVDQDSQVLASVYTSFDEKDGDKVFIWTADILDEPVGNYVSLYLAKIAVQRNIWYSDVQSQIDEEKKILAAAKKKKKVAADKAATKAVKKTKSN